VHIRLNRDYGVSVVREATAEADDRFSLVFELCPVGLALIGEKGVVLEANPSLSRLLGKTPEDLRGRTMVEFTHPEDRGKAVRASLAVTSGSQGDAKLEKRLLSADGSVVPVRVTIVHLDGVAGSPGRLTQIEDISDQRNVEDVLRREAHEDALTGLPNRRALDSRLAPMLASNAVGGAHHEASPRRDGREDADEPVGWALLFVDLDAFKEVNDRFGHRIGDEVLVAVARRLTRVTRDVDFVARLAGDEFVLLLKNTSSAAVELARARVRRSLAQPVRVAGRTVRISASVGSAIPRPAEPAELLLERADDDMYQQKRSGG
jgi:diguanylate cyclase (GGDEF)-like protein/PAS domain S-box-containing protein